MTTQTQTQTPGQTRSVKKLSASAPAHLFLCYLCTRFLLKYDRAKGNSDNPGRWVHIPTQSIKGSNRRYIDGDIIPFDGTPGKWQRVIDELIERGVIHRQSREVGDKGRKSYYYTPGNIDPSKYFDPEVIKGEISPLNELHTYMANCMALFEVEKSAREAFLYYLYAVNRERFRKYVTAFISLKESPQLFFKVDSFAGRVHTPFSSMETFLRPHITHQGNAVSSIDLKTSQPIILGEILEQHVPGNEFTKWTRNGLDVYQLLAERAKLESRKEGKALFFQLIFAPPKKQLEALYPGAQWVRWLNEQKRVGFARPHHSDQRHTRKKYNVIAYYLQYAEARIMGEVWEALKSNRIPFLSVHDEIIIPSEMATRAKSIFQGVISNNKYMSIPHAQTSTNKAQELIPEDVNQRSADVGHLIDDETINQVNNMQCHTIKDKAHQWAIAERIIHQARQQLY